MTSPTWLRELDDVPASVIDKMAAVNVHTLKEWMVATMENPQWMTEAGVTDEECKALLFAIWAQHLGRPLKEEKVERKQ